VKLVIAAALLFCFNSADANSTSSLASRKLLVSFVGKGTSLPIDVGVLKGLAGNLPTLFEPDSVVLSGSSSGSITTVYLSCFGITPASLDKLQSFLVTGNDHINSSLKTLRASEDPLKKVTQFLAGTVPALPIENLNAYAAAALGLEGLTDAEVATLTPELVNSKSKCRTSLPVVIVAANQDVLENRPDAAKFTISLKDVDFISRKLDSGALFPTRGDKEMDYANFSVSWKPTRLKDYLTDDGRKRFVANHPELNLRKDGFIGKACTYFVDESMGELLAEIPYSERLCDIRVMKTPYDRLLAIRASSAEPTYFGTVAEPSPSALELGAGPDWVAKARSVPVGTPVDETFPGTRNRMYWGGFVMPLVAQDIRRALPSLRVLATGFNRLDMDQEGKIIAAMSLVRSDQLSRRNEYWADFTIKFDADTQKKIRGRQLTRQEEYQTGFNEAKACLAAELRKGSAKVCRPLSKEVIDPEDEEEKFFSTAIERAVWGSSAEKATLEGERLPVWRGLGPLLVDSISESKTSSGL
jgi:hypothetical protein